MDVPPATAIAPYLPLLGRLGVAELRRLLAADEQRLVRAGGPASPLDHVRLRRLRDALSRARHPSAVS